MPISVTCACGKTFDVPTEYAGKKGKCQCGRMVEVPARTLYQAVEDDTTTPNKMQGHEQRKEPHLTAHVLPQEQDEAQKMSKVESLMSAAKTGDIETVKRLLYQKPGLIARMVGKAITVQTKDDDRRQPLHHAASGGHLQIVSFLLESGAPVDGKDKWGCTPLYYAAGAGQTAVASALLDKGAAIGVKRDCLGSEFALNDGCTPLHLAALEGHLPMVKLLLERGADWIAHNNKGEPPLVCALEREHLDIADALLSASGKTALPTGESVLLRWPVLAKAASVRWAIKHGANPTVRDREGRAPLHIVAHPVFWLSLSSSKQNPVETLCVLLEAGADVRATDSAGQTPLDITRANTPAAAGVAVAIGALDGQSQTAGTSLAHTLLTIGQSVQSILKTCATSPTPQEFASEAILKATKRPMPFFLISSIVRAVMDGLGERYPGCSVSDIVQQSTQAFDFVCPQCGPLNRQLIELAVSAKWLQEMNPNLTPTFAGPNVAAVFTGWCPKCRSTFVEACFDPTRLRLGPG